MKILIPVPVILILAVSSVMGRYVPTPEHAMSMGLNEDSIKWKLDHMDGGPAGVIVEFVPEGQTIQSWREMVAQQITFTKDSLEEHVKEWKAMVMKSDPEVVIQEESRDENSVTYSYKSEAFNEYSLRKFVKGKDGVYVLAYHVRLNHLKDGRIDLWKGILAKVKLVRNPQKG